MTRKNPDVDEADESDIEVSSHPKTWAAGVPGEQLSSTSPRPQLVLPVAPHAPTPQLVATDTKSSSMTPSQSSSVPSQLVSLGAGLPGAQLSVILPETHSVLPLALHAPTPQLVAVPT